MAKIITETNINVETSPITISISTKELIGGDQYEYTTETYSLSEEDKTAILALITPYLPA